MITNLLETVMLATNLIVQDALEGYHMRHLKDTNAVVPIGPKRRIEATVGYFVEVLNLDWNGRHYTLYHSNLVDYSAVHFEYRLHVSGTNEYRGVNGGSFELHGAEIVPLPVNTKQN